MAAISGSQGNDWQPPDQEGQWWDSNVASFVPNGVAKDPTGYVMQNGSLVGKSTQGQQGQSDPYGWVNDTLKSVSSTDDPNYWMNVIKNDPNGAGSAKDYWIDRIRRGDGSALVANGTLQKFQDSAPARSAGGSMSGFLGNVGGLISGLLSGAGPGGNSGLNFNPSTNLISNPAGQTQELLDQLKTRSNQSLDIDPLTDKIIRPQVDNYAATQERSRRNMLNDMAESGNPYQTGAMTAAGVQSQEHAAQATSDLQASLVANELQNRRGEIQNALSERGSMLTSEQQLALQDELGKLDAQLRNKQVNASLALGLGQLGLGQEGIDSGNDQFAANFGLNAADRANYWDWQNRQ